MVYMGAVGASFSDDPADGGFMLLVLIKVLAHFEGKTGKRRSRYSPGFIPAVQRDREIVRKMEGQT